MADLVPTSSQSADAPLTPTPAAKPTSTATAKPAVLRGKVFTLLVNNVLVAYHVQDGAVIAQYPVGPPPPADSWRYTGHYMALSKDKQRLFILAPAVPGQADSLALVDLHTAKLQASYSLSEGGDVFHAIAVGPVTGWIYLFGKLSRDTVVTVLDPDTGAVLQNWIARKADGYDWWPYEGAVSADERVVYVSYHGADTSGIDRFTIVNDGLQGCTPPKRRNVGCIVGHGAFILYGDSIVSGTGEGLILQEDVNGVIQKAFDTGLEGNHLTEFVVDSQTNRLYSVGSCGYSGGVSAVDLTAGGTYTLTEFGEIKWLITPAPPTILAPPEPGRVVKDVPCGERLALSPDSWLVVGKTAKPVPEVGIVGALLFLDARSGQVLRTIETSSEPVDVFVVADP